MRIAWYGTAALLFEEGETALAFDPFLGIPPDEKHPEERLPGCAEDFRRAGHVFVTHGHFDHILEIPAIFRGTGAKIHATRTPCETLLREGVPREALRPLSPGDEVQVGPFRIRAFQGRHCRFDGKLVLKTLFSGRTLRRAGHMLRLLRWNGRYPEKGETLFYELACGEKRVQIMGSLGLDPAVAYPTGADLLILPLQGRSDLLSAGREIVERLRPKEVVLDHYDDSFPPMTGRVEVKEFEKLIGERCGVPCRALEKDRPIDWERSGHRG